MFDDIVPLNGTYAATAACYLSADTVIEMMTWYAGAGGNDGNITDMTVKTVTTGYGSFTDHHFDDSDYIVTFATYHEDRGRWYECVIATHRGKLSLWAD
jgi:hypothetical protein